MTIYKITIFRILRLSELSFEFLTICTRSLYKTHLQNIIPLANSPNISREFYSSSMGLGINECLVHFLPTSIPSRIQTNLALIPGVFSLSTFSFSFQWKFFLSWAALHNFSLHFNYNLLYICDFFITHFFLDFQKSFQK